MRLFSVFGHPEDGRALLQARERVIDYKEDWERQEQFVFTYSPTYAGFYHCSVNLYVWHTKKKHVQPTIHRLLQTNQLSFPLKKQKEEE